MKEPKKDYLPAAGKDWMLPFYDPFTWLSGSRAIHKKLIHQSAIEAGFQVLEIGCGTGSLIIQAKRMFPGADFMGIDPDPNALAIASRKAQKNNLPLQFDQGYSEDLPYPNASFDRVLSAFMLHHLQPDAKQLAIQEAYRVLKPGGSLHIADFEETHEHGHGGGIHDLLLRRMHGHHQVSPQRMILATMQDADFEESREVARQSSIMGRVIFYEALRS